MKNALIFVGACFLTAAFIIGIAWAHGAHTMAGRQNAFLAGYATASCTQPAPLKERTGIHLPPIGVIKGFTLEDFTARH